jgi:hypothetical protein
MRCDGSTVLVVGVSSSPGTRRGSPYTSSAKNACRSSLQAVRMLSRTVGSASVHRWSVWHMIAAFSVRWKGSTRPFAAGNVGLCPRDLYATQFEQGVKE